MKAKQEHKKLFQELELWSHRKDAFSIIDFLKEKGITPSYFDLITNSSKKLMKIWGDSRKYGLGKRERGVVLKKPPKESNSEIH
jgi:hypothetical protein